MKILLNILFNNILIIFRLESFLVDKYFNWNKSVFDNNKSSQENMGFSNISEINYALRKVHENLQSTFLKYCNKTSKVLDIGCGVGLYLKDFPNDVNLTGIDVSKSYITKASSQLNSPSFYCGNYLNFIFDSKFFFIYSISVLQYVKPSKINLFIMKLNKDLFINGYVFLQYPHANTKLDLYYPNLAYIKYSPLFLEKLFRLNGFKILNHTHSFDNRNISKRFDEKKYKTSIIESFKDGAILIAQKIEQL